MTFLVLDNGSHSLKVGYKGDIRVSWNYTGRPRKRKDTLIGSDINKCDEILELSLKSPFDKGYICDWELQRAIWDHVFENDLKISTRDCSLIITEPYLNFRHLQEEYDQILFEEYQFESLLRTSSASLALLNFHCSNSLSTSSGGFPPRSVLIIDSGQYSSHIIPFYKQSVISQGIRRLDVGGNHLTTWLGDLLSYRQINLSNDMFLLNHIKEKCCFVSCDLKKDLDKTRKKNSDICINYALPSKISKDPIVSSPESSKFGFIWDNSLQEDEYQMLHLSNERFSVSEAFFHPSDFGVSQMGLPELVHDSLKTLPFPIAEQLYSNIVLIGGNAKIEGFANRLQTELQQYAPTSVKVHIHSPADSLTYACAGGMKLAARESHYLDQFTVNRKMYEEYGEKICYAKFL